MRERARPDEAPERMERADVDPDLMARALEALARTNRRFGGTRAVWKPLAGSLPEGPRSSPELRLLDVGAGGGRMGLELARRVRERGWRPSLLLGDRHPVALEVARRRTGAGRGREPFPVRLLRLDAARIPLETDSVDFLVSATTLHHLERGAARAFLREAHRVSRRGWVVADLRRSWPAYLAVKLLSWTLWRSNPLPRSDGPASVRRAFTPREAGRLLREAGVRPSRARADRPFRLVLLGGAAA